MRREQRVVASFFGDGATEEGVSREPELRRRSSGCRSCSSARTTATPSTRTRASARPPSDICRLARAHGVDGRSGSTSRTYRHLCQRRARRSRSCAAGSRGPCFSSAAATAGRSTSGRARTFRPAIATRTRRSRGSSDDALQARRREAAATRAAARSSARSRARSREAFAFAEDDPFPAPRRAVRGRVRGGHESHE